MAVRVFVLTVFFGFLFGIGPSRAQEPTGSGLAANSVLADALAHGNQDLALSELRRLDNSERQGLLTYLHSHSGANTPRGFEGGAGANGGTGGGAALANFNELMRLIETTIDGPWASNGGTATMMPFRSGVRIDANGVIERFSPDVSRMPLPSVARQSDIAKLGRDSIVDLQQLGAWQQPTRLRWVSLHQLDRQVNERLKSHEHANIAMEVLGGLYRIDYIAFDAETSEWLIGGPAGDLVATPQGDLVNRETRLPPLLLEDLLSVAPHILNRNGELGCSIDPIQERLVAAYKMAGAPGAVRMLREDPESWVDQWRSKLGKQRAMVVGLSPDSPTGYALVIADAHMKRLALGLEPMPGKLKNYWTESDLLGPKSNQSMIRFWFALSNNRILNDPERRIYSFAGSNVQVMSDAEMLNSKGERVVANSPDIAADAYARNFTAHFDELQTKYPIYGRLRHIFDLAVAMEIIRNEIAHGHGKEFESLGNHEIQPHLPVAPREIDSVAATHKRSDGTVQAIVSGGVSIQLARIKERIRKHSTQFAAIDIHPSIGEVLGNKEDSPEVPFWR